MTLYLDTSDLIKLYADEPDADRIRQLVRDADVVVTSVLAYPEARATLARRRREKLTTLRQHAAAVRQLDTDWPRFVSISFDAELAIAAGGLADRHHLRGGDAVHLASFEAVRTGAGDADVQFSSADERLSQAARRLG